MKHDLPPEFRHDPPQFKGFPDIGLHAAIQCVFNLNTKLHKAGNWVRDLACTALTAYDMLPARSQLSHSADGSGFQAHGGKLSEHILKPDCNLVKNAQY